jgi:RHS repeat-associated protein
MPDPKTRFYQFTGAMFNAGPSPPPAAPPPGDCCNKDGDPVSLSTGLFTLEATDLSLPDVLPIAVTRSYRPRDVEIRPFGVGTTHPYAMFLSSEQQYTEADLVLPDGAKIHYVRTSSGVGFTDAVFAHEERPNATPPTAATPTAFYKSVLIWNGNGWNLTLKNGTVYVFGENAPLVAIRDRSGNQITIAHANGQSGNITQVTSPHGRWIAFTYDTSNRITQIKDNIGRTVGYTYDGGGNLATVTDPENHVTSYTYDTSHQMLTVKPPNLQGTQTNLVTNEYTTAADAPTPVGWVKKQTHADGGVYLFAYTFVSGKISRTDVTNPGGFVRRVTFNGDGYSLGETRALGQPEQQVTNSVRQGGTQLVSSRANALGDQTTSTYDAKGNLTSVTQLAGTPDARTTSYTYEPTFNQIATVTDPLNHTWTMGYDALGRFTSVRDPLTHQITAVVNSAGLITSVTDPLQHTWQSVFVAADLVSTTDPLGRVRSRFVDAAGRVLATTDPRGRTTRLTVDKLNRTTMSTDALGGQTSFNYDANNNLLSLTDALAHVTTSTYDTSDRVATQMDPLLHTASYLYNSSSNLMQATDRTSQTTTAQYDALDRVTQVTYADNSTTQYVYDAGDRLTQIIDSVVGTITRSYDGLDRLTSESTSDGNVSYTYDADGRRATMTVAGQPTVTYAYDDAHRLTAITEGASAVTFTYDDAGRRTTLAQPNGVVTTYGYDAANQLTSLTYMQGPTTLGTLTYAYDAAGNRTSVGGAWARTGLPPALASASYDAGNRMTVWAGQAWSYDANGNLASDGLISYAWNARGQLAGLNGATTASFAYDAMGRRRARTTSGTTIYLYDGVNAAQELVGGSSTATTLTGGIDEAFQRTEGAAARAVLSDALGSTVALVDGSGTVQTQYTYDPFGATSTSGSASSNPAQYTGRENDGSGLYYYRARYYASNAARFISEDPAGFAGGINPYTYVKNNPVNFVDPMGLQGKSLAEDAFPHCNPSEKMKKCLKKILNEPVDSIDVVQDPLPSAGFAATVRPGVIFSFVPCAQFWQQPPLILEEYYHATKQITGWAGLLKYVALGLISGYDEHPWEREAQDFARKHKDELKKCLDCPQ